MEEASPKSRIATILLCWFLGYLGVHRFYVGKTISGIVYLLTGGIFLIGVWYDFIMLLLGKFQDKDGLLITKD